VIIEFAGLPSSGKSTVEKLLMGSLKKKGYFVQDRHEFRQRSAIPFLGCRTDRNAWIHKARTAFRWWSFISKTLYRDPEYLIGANMNRVHTILSTVRLYDDYDIIKSYSAKRQNLTTLNIAEGTYHHLVALNVWRGFHKKSSGCYIPGSLLSSLDAFQGQILIKTDLKVAVAKQRLTRRGLPRGWPANLDIDCILNKFEFYDGLLSDRLPSGCYKVLRIDTTGDLTLLSDRVQKMATKVIEIHNEST